MKKEDLIILGIAGVAVFFILKAGKAMPQVFVPANRRQSNTGLSYDPGPGYGDVSKWAAFADQARINGGWGIE